SERFVQLVTGYGHSCGLTAAGDAFCWGSNVSGEIGDGTGTGSYGDGTTRRPSPVKVAGNLKFQHLAAGANLTCGITRDGAAYCWGSNSGGRLGTTQVGVTPAVFAAAPTAVLGRVTFARIAISSGSVCALTAAGAAYCWVGGTYNGDNLGPSVFSETPIPVAGGQQFRRLGAGSGGEECGVTTSDRLFCWGAGFPGVGDGTSLPKAVPTAVAPSLAFSTVNIGQNNACAQSATSEFYCWGYGTGTGVSGNTVTVLVPTRLTIP
nr:hypothetical protein [Gemmatimonadota bacterium]